MTKPVVIGARLRRYPQFITLGPRPNLDDYPPEHMKMIREASVVYYPTEALAPQLAAMGKRLFPSLACHLLEGDKIKQTTLFKLLGLPHPRTRVFYGRQRREITQRFAFPFVAKKPRASSRGRGVYLIENQTQLDTYLAKNKVAYIQERLPISRDIRVVVIGFEPVCAYWRVPPPGEWRSNVARGATVEFSEVPAQAVELAVQAAKAADLDEVGIDLAMVDHGPLLLEFNVKYGRQGPSQMGLDVVDYVAQGILAGRLPPPRE